MIFSKVSKTFIGLLLIELCVVFFISGMFFEKSSKTTLSDACISDIIDSEVNLSEFYIHRMELKSIAVHAEAATAFLYHKCLMDKNNGKDTFYW